MDEQSGEIPRQEIQEKVKSPDNLLIQEYIPNSREFFLTAAKFFKKGFLEDFGEWANVQFDKTEKRLLLADADTICNLAIDDLETSGVDSYLKFKELCGQARESARKDILDIPEYLKQAGQTFIEGLHLPEENFVYKGSKGEAVVMKMAGSINGREAYSAYMEKLLSVAVEIGYRGYSITREQRLRSILDPGFSDQRLRGVIKEEEVEPEEKKEVKGRFDWVKRRLGRGKNLEPPAQTEKESKETYTIGQLSKLYDELADKFVEKDISVRFLEYLDEQLFRFGCAVERVIREGKENQTFQRELKECWEFLKSGKGEMLDAVRALLVKKMIALAKKSSDLKITEGGKSFYYTSVRWPTGEGEKERPELLRFYDLTGEEYESIPFIKGVRVLMDESAEARELLEKNELWFQPSGPNEESDK